MKRGIKFRIPALSVAELALLREIDQFPQTDCGYPVWQNMADKLMSEGLAFFNQPRGSGGLNISITDFGKAILKAYEIVKTPENISDYFFELHLLEESEPDIEEIS